MGSPRLRHALRADIPTVAEIWVDAFSQDPFLRWIQPDDQLWPAFGTEWMTFIASLTFERGHTYLADALDVAVAWVPPDVTLVDPENFARGAAIIAEHAGQAKADDTFATIVTARGYSLEVPHWTLQYFGVRLARQGGGLGAAAAAPGLATSDADGLPCGLVSTNPRNVGFYERLGFRVQAEVPTPDGTTHLRPMHRPSPSEARLR